MNLVTEWGRLLTAAETGELALEPGVATQCAQQCEILVGKLNGLLDRTAELAKIDGFGHLPSGIALAEKFSKKASGGDYSLDQALADQIRIVGSMRDTFLAIEARYAAVEDANTAAVAGVGSQIR